MPKSAFAVVALLAMLATACSGDNSKPPQGSGQPSASVTVDGEALPHSGAPKVPSPLPASVLAGDPCGDALTQDQLKRALGMVPAGKPGEIPTGRKCDWSNQESGSFVGVYYVTTPREGLSASYQNVKPQATVWRELSPLQGFPAVASVTPSGGSPDEFCQVSVGLADDLAFNASVFLGRAKKGTVDPCEGAEKVADMVVTTLRQKAGA
jgi:uncharacterized protein DUF3558